MTLSLPLSPEAVAPACRHIVLHLTERCPLDCVYCFVVKTKRDMSVETAEHAIDCFYSAAVSGSEYQVAISFFGGEPMLRVDLMETIVAKARGYHPNTYKQPLFGATTSGVIATPQVERLIRDAHMWLVISLDGTEKTNRHRPFANGRPTYEVVAKNLPKLVSWAHDAVVRVTFHPQTLNLLENVQHVLELGAPSVALFPVYEADWTGREGEVEEAYEALADEYIHQARRGRLLPLEATHELLRQWHRVKQGGSRPVAPCGVGTTLLSVDPDGHLMPCHRYLYRRHDWLGTVDAPELGEKRKPFVHLLSRDILGCDGCVAQPVCGGGCRAVVVEGGFDLRTGKHPAYCMLTRAHAKAVYRIYQTLLAEKNDVFIRSLRYPRPNAQVMQEFIAR